MNAATDILDTARVDSLRSHRVVVVDIRGRRVAFPSETIVECIFTGAIRSVPGTKPQVVGFTCHRRRAIPVIHLFGAATNGFAETFPKCIIVQYGVDKLCAVGVSSVVAVTNTHAGDFAAISECQEDREDLFLGVAAVGSEKIPVVDTAKLLRRSCADADTAVGLM